jgi:hypothetical protein
VRDEKLKNCVGFREARRQRAIRANPLHFAPLP